MAGVLDGVDQRTKLAGHNRFELLLFKLVSKQRFGINVFKVQEVIQCPPLTQIPNSHSVICGVAHLRGKTIPVLDLSMAIGMRPLVRDAGCYVIVTEYNRSIQGFLVGSVDRIINIGWEQVKAPPTGTGKESYLTAVTEIDGELIEVIDVEKVMKEVIGGREEASAEIIDMEVTSKNDHILVVDDSSVARNQVKRVCQQIGIECTLLKDGQEAWDHLNALVADGIDIQDKYSMIISDVEMPRMDGYTLATKIKADPNMKKIYLILHTSLSGVFNTSMVQKVGANEFLAKFDPDSLMNSIQHQLKLYHAAHS
ncbi:chemotaxis protein CheV [Methylomonas sp. MO1]|uniref:Chemotaxis protein CheV n=1 Tax=Methylomonas defluvii TaxID=3045149 RepID=A0ABU4UND2_9GAMM|nr:MULTISPECIES: chemotaxis protein CheV [unclassified Methylomonas]MDT4290373.1 chemotaxis protein CheV [Methylomonas sp. MO1]MDX8130214.1 chemotaxis protein CheV [Methylomonas sp. OY6]NOV32649.1 chemotaxis protein CheV [Methylomonas sp. ZR1]PKD40534.1 chemotaxis protein CheV [Methylomonas sp. Kb3]QBC28997.1 chemotaxis protein CheV [Methylomonas sp. LW13]